MVVAEVEEEGVKVGLTDMASLSWRLKRGWVTLETERRNCCQGVKPLDDDARVSVPVLVLLHLIVTQFPGSDVLDALHSL